MQCSGLFHPNCVDVPPDNVRYLSLSGVSWKCPGYRGCNYDFTSGGDEGPEIGTTGGSKMDEILKSIQLMRTDVKQLKSDYGNILKSVQFCSDKISDFEASLKSVNEKVKVIDKLSADNQLLRAQISSANEKIEDLEQYSRLNNLEIQGVPESTNENVLNVVNSIVTFLKVPFTENDIDAVHRVPVPPNKPREITKNIVVKFVAILAFLASVHGDLQTIPFGYGNSNNGLDTALNTGYGYTPPAAVSAPGADFSLGTPALLRSNPNNGYSSNNKYSFNEHSSYDRYSANYGYGYNSDYHLNNGYDPANGYDANNKFGSSNEYSYSSPYNSINAYDPTNGYGSNNGNGYNDVYPAYNSHDPFGSKKSFGFRNGLGSPNTFSSQKGYSFPDADVSNPVYGSNNGYNINDGRDSKKKGTLARILSSKYIPKFMKKFGPITNLLPARDDVQNTNPDQCNSRNSDGVYSKIDPVADGYYSNPGNLNQGYSDFGTAKPRTLLLSRLSDPQPEYSTLGYDDLKL
ncbi:l1 transposable element-related [Holotrichia oblita]|uniref:L1 transposable element-related n=1 Tax=Holotrichia oblita TaxID=644536 RepID=A0ACB9T9E3_HOLOL|nr:l1 transposable element-related [Holotrichia oblita]